MKNNLLKKRMMIWIIFITVLIVTLSFASYLTFTGLVIESENIVEETQKVEVWANSYIKFESLEDLILVKLVLDNGTVLSEKKVNAYLDKKEISENNSLFNLSSESPGIYSIKFSFQGSHNQYINPSEIEKQIEISEVSGKKEIKILGMEVEKEVSESLKQNETINITKIVNETINKTVINKTNQTIKNTNVTFIPTNCKEFEENILWSSGYSNNQSSMSYQVWYPKYNCSTINFSDCFIGNIEIETRFLYFEEGNQKGEGYVQISNPNRDVCENPEQETYEKYLAYEILKGEVKKFGKYCGNNKNPNAKCGIELENQFTAKSCYGIKSYADQNFLVDTFSIRYVLCGGGN